MKKSRYHDMRLPMGLVATSCLALAAACTADVTGPGGTIGAAAGMSPGAGGGPPAQGHGGSGVSLNGGSSGKGGTGMTSTGGTAGTGAGGTTPVGGGGAPALGPLFENPPAYAAPAGMLRRLTSTQFRNAVHDVFGVDTDVTELDGDSWDGNFAVIGASSVVTSDLGAEQYETAIENAVNTVFADDTARAKFIGCTPSGGTNDTCVRGFIQKLGLRAWRRPLVAAELDRLMSVAATAATTLGSPIDGAHWATVALFASPNFLYRPELGVPATDGTLRLTGYEMASRLAFLVWNSLPDQTLLDAAAAGSLGTADGVKAAVERMLDTPAGREAASAFADEYLRLDRIQTQAKDPSLFPEYASALQAGMVRDIRDTWAVLAFDDGASLLDLFTTPKVVVNKDLAALYGLDTAGLTSTSFVTRSLPADGPRLGLLSKAGFASEFANQKEGSPTLRGRYMQEQLLCTPISPPPPGVNTMLPDLPDTPMTKRQKLELHRTSPSCSACHEYMDPLGLPLENFDAIGRYRTTDEGLAIDPSGSFDSVDVADSRGLGAAVAGDVNVGRCIFRKYYTYAMGHAERAEDGSVENALVDSFQASGFKLRDLIVSVVTNDAFSTVAAQP